MKYLLFLLCLSLNAAEHEQKHSPKTPRIENITVNVTTPPLPQDEYETTYCKSSTKVKVAVIGLLATTISSVIALVVSVKQCNNAS